MNISLDKESFKNFPYPPNNKGNNGGVDLLRNPEKIDEISEISNFPVKKNLIRKLNAPDSPFFTFGCEASDVEGGHIGYLEFAFRDSEKAMDLRNYQKLFDQFEKDLRESPQMADFADDILSAITLEYSLVFYPEYNDYKGNKIVFYYGSLSKKASGQLLDIFFDHIMTGKFRSS